MLPFGVTIPATVPQRSEIPEGLMNNPVYICMKGRRIGDQVTGCAANCGSIPNKNKRFLSSPKLPEQPWDQASFLFIGYRKHVLQGQSGHLHLMPRLRISGAIHPLPHTIHIVFYIFVGRDTSVGIETRYGLSGPGIESP